MMEKGNEATELEIGNAVFRAVGELGYSPAACAVASSGAIIALKEPDLFMEFLRKAKAHVPEVVRTFLSLDRDAIPPVIAPETVFEFDASGTLTNVTVKGG
jgi:predicted lipid-binding transport protein (Tim44 family)